MSLPLTVILEYRVHSSIPENRLAECLQPFWREIECVLGLTDTVYPTWIPAGIQWQCLEGQEKLDEAIAHLNTPLVAYIPEGALPAAQLPVLPEQPCLIPWLLEQPLPPETACAHAIAGLPWIAHTNLLNSISHLITNAKDLEFLNLIHHLEQQKINFFLGTAPASSQNWNSQLIQKKHRMTSVLALIPHYQCERWLARCLRSLLQQTHPLDGIVVIDDGSGTPPIHIVEQFPTVTLMASGQRVGPYRLIQQVIHETDYDAYLFQDADDWSSGDRLQRLLQNAAQTGAELIGTQELRIEESAVIPVCYPLDVNQALSEKPGHGLLHPSSLVTRDLVMRIGGFATELRFGADSEFLLRAVLAARVVNIADYAYFRRKRPGSLTTHPETGLESPVRQALIEQCKARARSNHAALKAGQQPDLAPLVCADAIELHHITGPLLRSVQHDF